MTHPSGHLAGTIATSEAFCNQDGPETGTSSLADGSVIAA
jgi:hypothetical protein